MKRTTWMLAAVAKARHVKALSVQQIKEYLAGADMGYSKPAEIYDFPSPAHVLKLSDEIGLSAEQRAAASELFGHHKAEARKIGLQFVDTERELEFLFRAGNVQPAALASAVRRLARVECSYRLLHLETNRRMRALLTDEQVARYALLRGHLHPKTHQATMKGHSQ